MDNKTKLRTYLCMTGSTWAPISEFDDCSFEEELREKSVTKRRYGKEEYVTFPEYAETERLFAERVVSFNKKLPVDHNHIEEIIQGYEERKSKELGFTFSFNAQQKEAIHTLAECQTAVLTGGPGTGKTSVIKCVLEVIKDYYHDSRKQIVFTAPSGKAAVRLKESIGEKTYTLHSYVGFGANTQTKAPAVLFVDEFSMADVEILKYIVKRIYFTTRLFFIGDPEQLQCVGKGAILRDLINCSAMPVVQLTETYRQDESSTLFKNITKINEGAISPLADGNDFVNIRKEGTIEETIEQYLLAIDKYGKENTVILTALRRGRGLCSDELNRRLQILMTGDKTGIAVTVKKDGRNCNMRFNVGDPVIQRVNTKLVANGEVGKIVDINAKTKEISVLFPGYASAITYKGWQISDLDLAYAITVFKSQGSEYDAVIFPIANNNKNLDRSLIYTGVSRAKKFCVMLGTDKAIQEACRNRAEIKRITFLREEIDITQKSVELVAKISNL